MKIKQLVTEGRKFLRYHGIPFSSRDAIYLLEDILGVSSLSQLLLENLSLDSGIVDRYRVSLRERAYRKPVQYIKGDLAFYGLDLLIENGVLIPRQETEILADYINQFFKNNNITSGSLLDLCCGSGCLGLSLKKANPHLDVSLVDISERAVSCTRKNALRNLLDVNVVQANVFHFVFQDDKYDYLVCNPPYLSFEEILSTDPEVRCFEPWIALYGGKSGLDFYIFLAENLFRLLKVPGRLWLEFGSEQGKLVKSIFEHKGYHGDLISDFSGRNRFFFLEVDKYDGVS